MCSCFCGDAALCGGCDIRYRMCRSGAPSEYDRKLYAGAHDFESEPFAHVERNLYIQPRRHYVENVEALSVVARRRFDKRYSNDARRKKNRHRRVEQSNLYEHFDDALFDFFGQCKKIV